MAPPSKAESLRRLRTNIISIITSNKTWIENPTIAKSKRELTRRISSLEEQFSKFIEYNNDIIIEDSTETDECLLGTQDLYFSVISAMETALDEIETDNISETDYQSVNGTQGNYQRTAKIKLPPLQLPEFTGKPEDWQSFIERFENGVRGDFITDLDRLQYLIHSVKGTAAPIIKNLPIVKENYSEAIRLLKRRYENKRLNLRLYLTTLFSLPTVTENNENSLRELVDTTSSTIRAIENLPFKRDELSNALIVHLILSKLDNKSRELWESGVDDTKDEAEDFDAYNHLVEFLEQRLRVVSTVFTKSSVKSTSSASNSKPRTSGVKTSLVTQTSSPSTNPKVGKGSCPCCDKPHALYLCYTFKNLSVTERINKVAQAGICMNCFSNGHVTSNCKSIKCKVCSEPHHTMLHDSSTTQHTTVPPVIPHASTSGTNGTTSTPMTPVTTAVARRSLNGVLLATACVNINSNQRSKSATVLLDGASHVSFITTQLQQQLNLPTSTINAAVSGIGSSTAMVHRLARMTVSSRDNSFSIEVSALVIDRITEPLPSEQFTTTTNWSFLSDYNLADPRFNEPKEIDLLIGADLLYDILLPEFRCTSNAPTLQASRFGWLLVGPYFTPTGTVSCCKATLNVPELRAISQFLGINAPPRDKDLRSVDELECERLFSETYQRDPSGRFIVRLPRRTTRTVGESRQLAISRLKRTRITDQYKECIKEYEALGYITRCAPPTPDMVTYYIPHHAVYNNDNLRIVFDASMPSSNGNSLNDCLLVGETLQANLNQVLQRFRTFMYAFTADVRKMFWQILVAKQDRDLQRIIFLWFGELIDYIINSVTQGTVCAPYLAVRCLIQLAKDGLIEFPAAAAALLDNSYMDDLLTGADSPQELEELKNQLIALLRSAGMELSKWQFSGSSGDNSSGRALGLEWNTELDTFHFSGLANLREAHITTSKRKALSQVSSIFDPLGFIAPITITGKLLIQELWTGEADWDDPISDDTQRRFKDFFEQAACAAGLHFARFIGNSRTGSIELHGFADASKEAYAACIYTRYLREGQPPMVRLVESKTRVAPQRQPRTIPELELRAAALLAELLPSVATTLGFDCPWYAYSDSTIVLAYLAKDAGYWTPYVANRVRKVAAVLPNEQWSHVPGDQNPADLATRKRSYNELSPKLPVWQNGPEFLSQPGPLVSQSLVSVATVNPCTTTLATSIRLQTVPLPLQSFGYIFKRFSTFNRCRRAIGYVYRYMDLLRAKIRHSSPPVGPLSTNDLARAETWLIKVAQAECFPEEFRLLAEGLPVSKGSVLRALSPFLKDGLLRVGGRLENSTLMYGSKHPILLKRSHRLSLLLVRYTHHRFFHSGIRLTANFLKSHYWFVGDITLLIRQCIRTCARCIRLDRRKAEEPLMGSLPESRVTVSLPFTHVGVDYAGPISTRSKARSVRGPANHIKSYIAIFVCMASKAVHIEPVSEYSTAAFIATLQRFTARRGLPVSITSDNGTNFTGANNELQKWVTELSKDETIRNFSTNLGIDWKFNPPSAPHMGGLYEAAVKSMKTHFRRIIGAQVLTFEELTTILAQIEAILNSRPISPLPISDASAASVEVLTPSHLLIGRPLLAVPTEQVPPTRLSYTQRWRLITQLRNSFWPLWRQDYLRALQRRNKWRYSNARPYTVGDIVLIADEDTAPLTWPMGRIETVIPGKDGHVRVVDVRTRNKAILRRPVTKLVLLDSSSDHSTAAGC